MCVCVAKPWLLAYTTASRSTRVDIGHGTARARVPRLSVCSRHAPCVQNLPPLPTARVSPRHVPPAYLSTKSLTETNALRGNSQGKLHGSVHGEPNSDTPGKPAREFPRESLSAISTTLLTVYTMARPSAGAAGGTPGPLIPPGPDPDLTRIWLRPQGSEM